MHDLSTIYSDLIDLGRADGYLDEILEIAQRTPLFEAMSEDEIRVLCHHMRCYAAPRHYAVLEAGGAGGFLILILTGAAELRMHLPHSGAEKSMELAPGATVGETLILGNASSSVRCIALSPMDFAVLSRSALDRILLQAPRLGNKLLLTLVRMLSARLNESCRCDLQSVA